MKEYLGLLRGINVGGRNRVAMADLRKLFDELGFAGSRTLLQSGNIVFEGGRRKSDSLERLFERETDKRLGVAADYFVRTADELRTVIAGNPFQKEAELDPSHLVVVFLKAEANSDDVRKLQSAVRGREQVRGVGRHLYCTYPDGIGESKFTGAMIEKTLGTRGSARNWNTVLKLDALCNE